MIKKFLFIIPTLDVGGAEISTIILLNKLAEENHTIHILTSKSNGLLRKKINKKAVVIQLPYRKLYKCIIPISNYIKSFKPNILFSIIFNCNIVAMLSAFISHHKCYKIISERQSTLISLKDYNIFNRQLIKFLSFITFYYSNNIISVSDGVKSDLEKLFPPLKNKINTIHNGFDIQEIKLLSKESANSIEFNNSLKSNKKILLACGRLADQKGFISLINASHILKNKLNFHLFIIGEGPQRNKLESLIKKKDLDKNISLLGKVENPFSFMAKCDLFILSSKSEGLPGVLIQALICKANIISTDCKHGPKEILKNGLYGRLVKVGDFKELAEGILKQIKDPINYNSSDIENTYSIDYALSKYKKIFKI